MSSLIAIPGPGDAVFPDGATPGGFLGIVMLDTRFPRPPGDVGHPATFGVPTRRRVVPGAVPRSVVASAASLRASGLHRPFVEAMRALEREGARALTTSCGFLVLLQKELQAAVGVPVVSSSLLQLPALLQAEAQVGVLTISAEHLGTEHLLAARVPTERLADVIVQGLAPDSEVVRCILGNLPTMNLAQAEADTVQAALALRERAPQLCTVVLECTNLPPHAHAICQATGWQTRSLLDMPALRDWARG